MTNRPAIAMLVRREHEVFNQATIAENEVRLDLCWPAQGHVSVVTAEEAAELMVDVQGCVTSWGSPQVDARLLALAPDLRIIAHAAGSIKSIASDAVWDKGITVTSAAASDAVDVAHFTLGIMMTSVKQVIGLGREVMAGNWRGAQGVVRPNDFRDATVGIIAASHVGRNVLGLLKHFEVETLLFDPYCSEELAASLGARLVPLDTLFRKSDIISLHAPAVAETRHLIDGRMLGQMKDGAIFINTSRGSLVDEAALVAKLQEGRIWAYLDVTDPEPPPPGSPLYSCPNLIMTPHIAGSMGRGRRHMGALAFKELNRFFAGEPPLFPVTREMLPRIA